MDTGFAKADSRNLPKIDSFMIHTFYCNNPQFMSAEIKNVKTQRSSRENYGDDAVGFVQIKRENDLCIVKAKITPEHRVRNKGYGVTVRINENEEKILSSECHDCAASDGGCKHSVSVLFWLYRRSEEPAVTSVECYWRTSKLSKVGKTIKSMSLKEMFNTPPLPSTSGNILDELKKNRIDSNSVLLSHFSKDDHVKCTSIHHLITNFLQFCENHKQSIDADKFLQYCKTNITDNNCQEINKLTTLQSKNRNWYEARYGRITASKLYEAAKSKTFEGSLTETIFGCYKVPETKAMKRGLALEKAIINVVKDKYNIKIKKSGLVIDKNYPIFGASPDAVSTEYCIEIKAPAKQSTIINYIDSTGNICKKPNAQIQLQMFLLKKKHALYCVASPQFETDGKVQILKIDFNKEYCEELMTAAEIFWKNAIFPKLVT